MPHSIVRLAQEEDMAAIAAIYKPYVLRYTVTFEEVPPSAEEMLLRRQALAGFPWLVCEAEGQVLGYAYAGQLGQRAGYRWAAAASVYIKEGCRHGGVGRALYTALAGLLRAQGYRALYGVVASPNPESERFHERMGFERQGFLKHAGYKFGKPLGVIYYAKDLLPVMADPPLPIPFGQVPAQEVAAILGEAFQAGSASSEK